jgi:hypothetical protein
MLATAQPRVQGTMTYRAATGKFSNGESVPVLEITTNYVWVYAFAGRTEQPGDHLVLSHEQATDKNLLEPETHLDPSADPQATSSEPPSAFYRPDHPIDTGDSGCR